MTIHVVADTVGQSALCSLSFLRMSAANARAFLTDLRNGCYPIAATGDEDGTVEIEFSIPDGGLILSIGSPGEQRALHHRIMNPGLDLQTMATELLADLGA